MDLAHDGKPQAVVLAGGCFWCTEGFFRAVKGVLEVVSGYTGGTAATANYQAVCSGRTDHAEAIIVRYDPTLVSFGQLLKLFFSAAHDPTQRNRQGNDRGREYRSAIFYANLDQRQVATAYIDQIDATDFYDYPLATTLEPLMAFYPAETYHQNYAALNPDQPYIQAVSQPKIDKLRRYFPNRVAK